MKAIKLTPDWMKQINWKTFRANFPLEASHFIFKCAFKILKIFQSHQGFFDVCRKQSKNFMQPVQISEKFCNIFLPTQAQRDWKFLI